MTQALAANKVAKTASTAPTISCAKVLSSGTSLAAVAPTLAQMVQMVGRQDVNRAACRPQAVQCNA
jgi:hypothetical protein